MTASVARVGNQVAAALVVLTATASIILLLDSRLSTRPSQLPLAIAAVVAWSGLAVAASRPGVKLPVRLVTAGVVATLAVAVVLPPRQSNDLWAYASWGRLLLDGLNPYLHSAHDIATHPFAQRVGSGWAGAHSVYGPVWNGYQALGAAIAGRSALVARLFFQLTAAGATAGALAWLWKRWHNASVVAFVGLHPLIIVRVVNGGHNDAVLGLLILLCVGAASDARWWGSALWVALAILVKVTAALVVPALVLWAWHRGGARAAARVAIGSVVPAALLYAIVGGHAAVQALRDTAGRMSRASIWQAPRHWWLGARHGLGPFAGMSSHRTLVTLTTIAIYLVAAFALAAAIRCRRDPDPDRGITAAVGAYLFLGPYVLAPYSAWLLPVAARPHRSALAWCVAIQAGALLVIYQLPQQALAGPYSAVTTDIVAFAFPIAAAFAYLVTTFLAPAGRASPLAPRRSRLGDRAGAS